MRRGARGRRRRSGPARLRNNAVHVVGASARVTQNGAVDITHLFAGIAVSDFQVARGWYARILGSPADTLPREDEAVWHAVRTASIYVTVDPERAGHGLLTLAVKDVDEKRIDLERRGIIAGEGAEANGLWTLTVTDPDGNRIKFFEDPSTT